MDDIDLNFSNLEWIVDEERKAELEASPEVDGPMSVIAAYSRSLEMDERLATHPMHRTIQ